MKILLVNDYLKGGGAENVCYQTYLALKEINEVKIHYAAESHARPASPLAYIYSRKNQQDFSLILNDYKPDIIHFHNYYHSLSPSLLAAAKQYKIQNKNARVILTAHDYHLICPNSGLYYFNGNKTISKFDHAPSVSGFLFKRLDHRGMAFSTLKKLQWIFAYKMKSLHKVFDLIISPSNFLIEKFKEKLGDTISFKMIRNPYTGEFKHANDFDTGPVDLEKLKLVFIGRLTFEKGILEFIPLLSKIKTFNFSLDIYGEGEFREKIEHAIKTHGLDDKVMVKGFLPQKEILSLLGQYHALVLPSLWYENAPLSIVEAAFNNLSILTPDYGGLKEMATICGSSYVFDHGNPTSLEIALEAIIKDIRKGKQLERDLQSLQRQFSPDAYIEELTKTYTQLEK